MDNLNITIAPSDAIDTFPAEMDRVLSAVGHPEALVTDESQVADFMIGLYEPTPEELAAHEKALGLPLNMPKYSAEDKAQIAAENDKVIQSMSELMGRPVAEHEYLCELARQLHLKAQPTTRH